MKTEIHRVLGYSRPAINRALTGSVDTDISREIRDYALSHGGVEVKLTKITQNGKQEG